MARLLTDAQTSAALLLLNGGRVDLRQRPRPRPPAPLRLERTCTECGQTLPLQALVRIQSRRNAVYGRCRVCRARRARERYQNDPAEREAQKATVRRNRARRKQVTELS